VCLSVELKQMQLNCVRERETNLRRSCDKSTDQSVTDARKHYKMPYLVIHRHGTDFRGTRFFIYPRHSSEVVSFSAECVCLKPLLFVRFD